MSECIRCGRWSLPDRDTGYDADALCPTCQSEAERQADEDGVQLIGDFADFVDFCLASEKKGAA